MVRRQKKGNNYAIGTYLLCPNRLLYDMMHFFILALFFLAIINKCAGAKLSDKGFGFDFFSRTNTKNVTLPTTRAQAEQSGWFQAVREDGTGVCRKGLGVEYTEGATTHSKSRPMSLFFEASPAGRLSGFTVRAWFTNSSFYNPTSWQLPSFGATEEGERWVTITTRDPSTVCAATALPNRNTLLGDRLLMNIDASGKSLVEIPTIVPSDPDGAWKFGACQLDMSRHWGYPLDGQASSLYGYDHGVHVLPVIPMYSVPEGDNAGVTALAFFTTEEQITYKSGGVWDATGTPEQLCSGNFCLDATKCEYGEGNSVFHVFFVDQWSDVAQCGSGGSPDCPVSAKYF
jgi:hypothetical protein